MPHLTLPLSPGGCVLDLFVGVSTPRADALRKAGRPIPNPVQLKAIIDTGASSTLVCSNAIAPLGLMPTGTIPIHTPSTAGSAAVCAQYDVMLVVYHPKTSLVLGTVPVIANNLAGTGVQALIGRDVLAGCLFVYDGTTGLFSLAF
jgi:hypothetical protein